MRSKMRGFLAFLTLLVLAACASDPTPPVVKPPAFRVPSSSASGGGAFPMYPELQPQIAFWRSVYSAWGRHQVALHDDRYLDVVYEVITLPGLVGDTQTDEQKEFVKGYVENLKDRLRQMEYKVSANAPLTPAEQNLAKRIRESSGGTSAVFGSSNRVRSQRGMRERFKRGLEISGRYDAVFRNIFRQAGLPEDLAYLPHVESSFQNHAASSVGAVGMWQFMPGTARHLGLISGGVDQRMDPVASARAAAQYLRNAHGRLQSWPLALTSYNHGVGGMSRARSLFGNDFMAIVRNYSGAGFGFASRNFYAEFMAARDIARNPQRFFAEGIRYEVPLSLDQIRIQQAVYTTVLRVKYGVSLEELNSLNKAWSDAVQSGRIPVPAGTEVWLPSGTITRLAQQPITDSASIIQ